MEQSKKAQNSIGTGITQDFMSLKRMEPFIPPMDFVNLGKKLLGELKLEKGVDTLGRWMSFYLAQMLTKAQNSTGSQKAAYEKECLEVILRIWDHRASLPGRPLQSFTPIFEMLEVLHDPERSYFVSHQTKVDGPIGQWLSIASNVDLAARALMRWCIRMATAHASEKEKKWLKYIAKDGFDANDTKAIRLIMFDAKGAVGEKDDLGAEQRKTNSALLDHLNYLLKVRMVIKPLLLARIRAHQKLMKKGKAPNRRTGPIKKQKRDKSLKTN